jgi:hypothetical protein
MFMGRHSGSELEYFFHLILPFILVLSFRKIGELSRLTQTVFFILIVFRLYDAGHPLQYWRNIGSLNRGPDTEWQALRVQVQKHHTILAAESAVPLLIENHKEIYDNGQTMFFNWRAPPGLFFGVFDGLESRMTARMAEFKAEVGEMIQNRKFDLVMTVQDEPPDWSDQDTLTKNYQPARERARICIKRCIDLWEPRS